MGLSRSAHDRFQGCLQQSTPRYYKEKCGHSKHRTCKKCKHTEAVCERGYCASCCYGCEEHVFCRKCKTDCSVCQWGYCDKHCFGCDQHPKCKKCKCTEALCVKGYCASCCFGCEVHDKKHKRMIEEVRSAIQDCHHFSIFADSLAPRSSNPPKWLMNKIHSCASEIWPWHKLKLQGSAKKGTNIRGSDFDFHLLTSELVDLDQMHRLRDALMQSGVEVTERIMVALKLHYYTNGNFGTVEVVPVKGSYFDADVNISKADSFFFGNHPAQRAVRVLKYLFSQTEPKLKNCFIEDLVKIAAGERPYNPIPVYRQQCYSMESASGLPLFEKVVKDLRDFPSCDASSVLERHRTLQDQEKLEAMAKVARQLLDRKSG
eukprot:Skav230231  [mRNA]  locus=scaffold4204:70842:71963:- [translate_table: standard]